ncbi:MAG: hypothetical protein LBJ64_11085 [Deltaproteobacteria bacterium]|nr:hypothetical protein [Deltaproteobacteria bacterium]
MAKLFSFLLTTLLCLSVPALSMANVLGRAPCCLPSSDSASPRETPKGSPGCHDEADEQASHSSHGSAKDSDSSARSRPTPMESAPMDFASTEPEDSRQDSRAADDSESHPYSPACAFVSCLKMSPASPPDANLTSLALIAASPLVFEESGLIPLSLPYSIFRPPRLA